MYFVMVTVQCIISALYNLFLWCHNIIFAITSNLSNRSIIQEKNSLLEFEMQILRPHCLTAACKTTLNYLPIIKASLSDFFLSRHFLCLFWKIMIPHKHGRCLSDCFFTTRLIIHVGRYMYIAGLAVCSINQSINQDISNAPANKISR